MWARYVEEWESLLAGEQKPANKQAKIGNQERKENKTSHMDRNEKGRVEGGREGGKIDTAEPLTRVSGTTCIGPN